ncbi:MAG: transposase [Candidatus Eremiobacteraeota bacterium]|nr:transposase [Candidatus Eremiobacteraeota bacterium]
MRKSRFTDTHIVSILKELDAGTPAAELARKHGVHANTIESSPASCKGWLTKAMWLSA